MYDFDDVVRAIANPRSAVRELNRLVHTRGKRWDYNYDGESIFSKEWDNLIILDACRYDTFSDLMDISGDTGYITSRGAATYEFVRGNFANKKLHDTVYVGANTWFLKLKDELNAEVHAFIDLQHGDNDIEFAVKELNIPTPESVTAAAKKAHQSYPHKRLIIHYLQPHHPFIGEKGRNWFKYQSSSLTDVISQTPNATRGKIKKAYRENLDLVLPEAQALCKSLPGRTVITADHGEMLGDRHQYLPARDYGHHGGIYNKALVKVPWHVAQSSGGKRITSDPPEDAMSNYSQHDIDERLRNLGYKI